MSTNKSTRKRLRADTGSSPPGISTSISPAGHSSKKAKRKAAKKVKNRADQVDSEGCVNHTEEDITAIVPIIADGIKWVVVRCETLEEKEKLLAAKIMWLKDHNVQENSLQNPT